MRKLLLGLLIGLGLTASIAYAAPLFNYSRSIVPETNTTYDLGSSTPTRLWNNIFTNNLLVNSQANTGGCAYFDASGYLLGGATCAGGGGGGSGGGWATSTGANGAVVTTNYGGAVGINSTTPWATLTVVGKSASTTPVFVVASSTNAYLLRVASNGSTTLSSLGTGPVYSSSGSLYTNGTTGTGSTVQQTSPTLITPVLGVASGTALTLSGNLWTATTSITGTLSVSGSSTISSLGTGIVQSTSGGGLYVVPTNTYQPAGTYVTNVSASGNIASSGGTTPNITFTGVLPLANGGIATTTLGNLTVGTNLSVTGGQQVLIGTSTQISLGTAVVTSVSTTSSGTAFTGSISSNNLALVFPVSPTFTTLNVTGQTTLGNASATALTVSGVSTLATTTIAGTLSVTGIPTLSGVSNCNGTSFLQITSGLFSCGTPAGGGGGAGGGWATSTTANGLIITNTSGGAVGINSSTPWAALVVEGNTASTTPVLIIASSTGSSYLTVASNGSTTITSLGTGPVYSSTGSLYTNGTTGTGSTVQQTSPTLITPILGTASGTALTLSDNFWVTGNTALTGTLNVTGKTTLANASTTNLSIATNAYLTNIASGNCLQTGAGGLITSAGAACGSGGSGNSAWTIGNGLIYTATSTDLIGIGTTTPNYKLSVVGTAGNMNMFNVASSSGTSVFRIIDSNAAYSPAMAGYGVAAAPWVYLNAGAVSTPTYSFNGSQTTGMYLPSTDTLGFSTAATQRMTISSGGNVGINSSTPNQLLSVGNSVVVTSGGLVGIGTGNPTTTQSALLNINDPSFARIIITASTSPNQVVGFFDARADTVSRWQMGTKSNHSMVLFSNDAARLGIWASGGLAYGSTYSFTNDPGANTAIFEGNVGIGTTTPTQKLSVSTTSTNGRIGFNYQGSSATYAGYDIQKNGITQWIMGTDGANTNFDFVIRNSPNSVNALAITQAGLVGINTTSPTSTLSVQGTGSVATIFNVTSSTGTSLLSVAGNGSTTLSSLASAGCVASSASGQLYVTSCGGGSLSGGTNGYLTRWTSASAVSSGASLDNGTVAGVNATSSTTSFLVQGTSNLIPFKVASSTGTAMMTVSADGDVTLNRTNSGYTQTQFVISSALAGGTIFSIDAYGALSGSSGAYTINGSTLKLNSNGGTSILTNYNNSNNSNLQIFTGYGFSGLNANQYLQLGYSGSGSVINSYILNGVGKTTIGTVAPTPGTSTVTTPSLLVEDTSGNSIAPIFAVASSTNTIILQVNYDGKVGINTSTPVADFQATNQTSSATTTIEFGRAGQGKGTCMKIYDPAGVAWYVSVSVTGTLSASASTCKTGF